MDQWFNNTGCRFYHSINTYHSNRVGMSFIGSYYQSLEELMVFYIFPLTPPILQNVMFTIVIPNMLFGGRGFLTSFYSPPYTTILTGMENSSFGLNPNHPSI